MWSWKSRPGEAHSSSAKKLMLAGPAGLLSPAKNFPDGKSRPITLISGNCEPHGALSIGHVETVILRTTSSAVTLLKDTHGCPPWLLCRLRGFYR